MAVGTGARHRHPYAPHSISAGTVSAPRVIFLSNKLAKQSLQVYRPGSGLCADGPVGGLCAVGPQNSSTTDRKRSQHKHGVSGVGREGLYCKGELEKEVDSVY